MIIITDCTIEYDEVVCSIVSLDIPNAGLIPLSKKTSKEILKLIGDKE